ncbi:alpha/beta hydrolase [Lactiplantibacillus plantarum]|uniref:Dienelactone hydrolase n=1 Tax=Lactiplantibacillus plantarum TaxID=1590 RepID=A0A165R9W1_LACPN|nr:alpha/beta hydrolase [Lactiplantibacillus plantarum]KZU92987.1 Dienelactone hydrolase [Lactiplantibacillus plantarum]MCW0154064.1 alpha/beta hydrolase [Lactiplantibacillus plantarum]MDG6770319.1 alpha/beta hydrolase [Lactiplantibacillus plantarum]QSE56714.1 alpha/beta hydrolase [Lactiplantibacillus plantarum]QXN28576.1 alpha/beta hydrolase [Lactiplantibacillus plantarum subsp. plantarum]
MQNKKPVYLAGEANVKQRNQNLATGDTSNGTDNWYESDQVTKTPVTFKNLYGMNLSGNLFEPVNSQNQILPAIVVGAPNGAVKEQSANLYATKMAEYGFITLAFDQVFWGASDGEPRNAMAPDLYSESFSAATDYLTTLDQVDNNRIAVLGICASGSFAINELKVDTRLKALATVSLTDMGAVARMQRDAMGTHAMVDEASNTRTSEAAGQETSYTSGTPEEIGPDSDAFAKEFYDFYRTQRGAAATTTHPTLTSFAKLLNFYSLSDVETISPRPLLFIAGENAMSLGFSEDAYNQANEPKELVKVKNAGHVDLYDRTDLIPFAKLNDFFTKNLIK